MDKDDNIYAVENSNHRMQKFDSQGVFVSKVGTLRSGSLQFEHPYGICFNHNDKYLYVADSYNHTPRNSNMYDHLGLKEKEVNSFNILVALPLIVPTICMFLTRATIV